MLRIVQRKFDWGFSGKFNPRWTGIELQVLKLIFLKIYICIPEVNSDRGVKYVSWRVNSGQRVDSARNTYIGSFPGQYIYQLGRLRLPTHLPEWIR